jgi:hypothetical protein
MKELKLDVPYVKKIDKEVKKEEKYIASMQPHPGQHLFSYDGKKIEVITDKDYEPTSIAFNTGFQMEATKRLLMKNGYMYVVALNKKNAAKKFLRLSRQKHYS